MQRLEISGAVRPIYGSLGVKRLITLYLPVFLGGGVEGYKHKIFFSKASTSTLGPSQPPTQWVPLRVVRQTTHAHLVPRLRISGATPPLLHVASLNARKVYLFYLYLNVLTYKGMIVTVPCNENFCRI
jgi:hypothetical protein